MRCLARTGRSRRSGGSGPAKLRGGRAGTARGKPSSSSLKSRRPGLLPRETETTGCVIIIRISGYGRTGSPPRTPCPLYPMPVRHQERDAPLRSSTRPRPCPPRPSPDRHPTPFVFLPACTSGPPVRGRRGVGSPKLQAVEENLWLWGAPRKAPVPGHASGLTWQLSLSPLPPITSLILLPSTSSISGGSSPSSPYHLGLRHHAISPPPLSLSTPTAIATYSNQPLRRRRVYIYISIRIS
jgi:hypothetical protein